MFIICSSSSNNNSSISFILRLDRGLLDHYFPERHGPEPRRCRLRAGRLVMGMG